MGSWLRRFVLICVSGPQAMLSSLVHTRRTPLHPPVINSILPAWPSPQLFMRVSILFTLQYVFLGVVVSLLQLVVVLVSRGGLPADERWH